MAVSGIEKLLEMRDEFQNRMQELGAAGASPAREKAVRGAKAAESKDALDEFATGMAEPAFAARAQALEALVTRAEELEAAAELVLRAATAPLNQVKLPSAVLGSAVKAPAVDKPAPRARRAAPASGSKAEIKEP
jgi:hypothetical protein